MAKPPPSYEALTDGITVRVVPRFLHDESEPARYKYLWAYTIEVENGSQHTWQLVSRHWEIVDAAGRMQVVDGEGVVGQKPVLGPGERFRYTSGAPLTTPSGVMSGHYHLTRETGEGLDAHIPMFSLDSPYDNARPS